VVRILICPDRAILELKVSVKMRQKYIDEAVGGVWFIFGEHEDGSVDISNGTNDVFTKLSLDQALKLVEIRDEFLEKLYQVLQ
jgi:hypothetical protein